MNKVFNNKKNMLIILLMVLVIIISILIYILVKNDKNQANSSKLNEEQNEVDNDSKPITLTNEEKMQEYGEYAEDYLDDCLEKNYTPQTQEIEEFIEKETYNFDCQVFEIYKDGSVYLAECKIEGSNELYSYGEQQLSLVGDIIYEPNLYYMNYSSTELDFFEDSIEVDFVIEDGNVYISYNNKKILIENIQNVKQVVVGSFYYNCVGAVPHIYILTTDGDIYKYDKEYEISDDMFTVEETVFYRDEFDKYVQFIANNLEKMTVDKSYEEIVIVQRPDVGGVGCAGTRPFVVGYYNNEKYVVEENETLNDYYPYVYLTYGSDLRVFHYIGLDGYYYIEDDKNEVSKFIVTDVFELYENDKEINYVITTDNYVYKINNYEEENRQTSKFELVNDSKLKNINIDKSKEKVNIEFEDGSNIIFTYTDMFNLKENKN